MLHLLFFKRKIIIPYIYISLLFYTIVWIYLKMIFCYIHFVISTLIEIKLQNNDNPNDINSITLLDRLKLNFYNEYFD